MGRVGGLVWEMELGHEVVDGHGFAIDSDSEKTLETEGRQRDAGRWVTDGALIAHLDGGRMGREGEEGFQVFDLKNILKFEKWFLMGRGQLFGSKKSNGWVA